MHNGIVLLLWLKNNLNANELFLLCLIFSCSILSVHRKYAAVHRKIETGKTHFQYIKNII